jgi:hypothetical protein
MFSNGTFCISLLAQLGREDFAFSVEVPNMYLLFCFLSKLASFFNLYLSMLGLSQRLLRFQAYVATGRSKILCAPDDYSTKNTQKYFKQFQSLTMIT